MIPSHIIIHHSLTADGATVSWNAITQYHMSKGWIDNGYQYGIERVGDIYQILKGRMDNQVGAHCTQQYMNYRSIGVCMVGNFDLGSPPREQMEKLVKLVLSLQQIWKIPSTNVQRHSEYASYKTCPGKLFPWEKFKYRLKL